MALAGFSGVLTEDVALPGGPRIDAENSVIALARQGVRSSVVRLPPTVRSRGRYGFVSGLIGISRATGTSGHLGDGSNRWPSADTRDTARLHRLALESRPASRPRVSAHAPDNASVGTCAGQVVMRGFLRRRIPLFARRTLTMAPALLVLCAGLPVTSTLVFSQVVLAFGIPFALAPLVVITRRRDLMGPLANRPATTAASALVCAMVIRLNAYLVVTMVKGG
ncbi:divalent metal cation transporter [Streptomyces malaysiensis]|uniref:Uncharacterized protein n=1 Tax=Streptomyces malaysiensis TaxID=92644 RepID=A0A7X5WWS1_STRMQ|nr:divalent metal cation transporter [Streptomyces malaysiensis]NIY62443.1 hypothetical protein [Streptomyces malaysiensis]